MVHPEKLEELRREEAQERREQGMNEWIQDNKETLKTEYVEENEDDFNEFCKESYRWIEE